AATCCTYESWVLLEKLRIRRSSSMRRRSGVMTTLLWKVDDVAASSHGYPFPNESVRRTTKETERLRVMSSSSRGHRRAHYRVSGLVQRPNGCKFTGRPGKCLRGSQRASLT